MCGPCLVWFIGILAMDSPITGLRQDLDTKALDDGEDAHHGISAHVRMPGEIPVQKVETGTPVPR